MAKRISWSNNAKYERRETLEYWFKRNGNKFFSRKLAKEFRVTARQIHEHNYLGHPTDFENVRVIVCEVYFIFYEIKKDLIEIFKIWDGRRNPEELELK